MQVGWTGRRERRRGWIGASYVTDTQRPASRSGVKKAIKELFGDAIDKIVLGKSGDLNGDLAYS